jgi:hypothetical protein
VLKTGIRLEGTKAADNIWLTCCAFHNFLIEVDGLDEKWQHGIQSDWEGTLGNNDVQELRNMAPFAIRRLQESEATKFGSRQHERECAIPQPIARSRGGAIEENSDDDDNMTSTSNGHGRHTDENGALFVNSLSYEDFRHQLVEHFDVLHGQKNRIVWSARQKNY